MRTEVNIRFDSSDIPGGAQAILRAAGCGPDVATVEDVAVLRQIVVAVTLNDTDPRLSVLLGLLQQHGEDPSDIRWDRYTDEELERAPLIAMWRHNAHVIFGGPRMGTSYDMTHACGTCGSGARQTSALMVDGEDLLTLKGRRVASTPYHDILVDGYVAERLEAAGVTGISLRGVFAVMKDKRQVKQRWQQLCATHIMPPVSPGSTGLERKDICRSCGRGGFDTMHVGMTRLAYRSKDLEAACDVNLTWEWFGVYDFDGNVGDALFPYPWVLVTPKVWRIFRDAGVTSEFFHCMAVRAEDS